MEEVNKEEVEELYEAWIHAKGTAQQCAIGKKFIAAARDRKSLLEDMLGPVQRLGKGPSPEQDMTWDKLSEIQKPWRDELDTLRPRLEEVIAEQEISCSTSSSV